MDPATPLKNFQASLKVFSPPLEIIPVLSLTQNTIIITIIITTIIITTIIINTTILIITIILSLFRRKEDVDNESPQGPSGHTSQAPLSRLKDW